MTDEDAWVAYPAARAFYDRQWLAAQLGYVHGPSGTHPEKPGRYFVKPVHNLLGMGIGAAPVPYAPGGPFEVPPGYFWSACLNVEFIGGKVIECHLRSGLGDWRGSPAGATRAMPVWEGQRVPAGMVPSEENCGGLMPIRRLGFVYSADRRPPC